jgi:rare lipoprotein A
MVVTAVALLLIAGCAGRGASTNPAAQSVFQTGIASYYHSSLHGNTTANGEVYDENELTAAHRSLPFGTEIRVRNLENGKSVRLRVNDRGPFVSGRIVDVSYRAAQILDFVRQGLVDVTIEIVP